MTDEEVTNLIARARNTDEIEHLGDALDLISYLTDALERSAAQTTEYGVQFEQKNPEPLHDPTITMRVDSESSARAAVTNGAPLSGINHRVVVRQITEWIPAGAVVPEDLKPTDPPLIMCVTCSKRFADGETAWHHAQDKGHSLAKMVPARYGVTPKAGA